MFPYEKKAGLKIEQWKSSAKFQKNSLPQSEVVSADIISMPFVKKDKQINTSALVIQYKDQILIKFVTLDFQFQMQNKV